MPNVYQQENGALVLKDVNKSQPTYATNALSDKYPPLALAATPADLEEMAKVTGLPFAPTLSVTETIHQLAQQEIKGAELDPSLMEDFGSQGFLNGVCNFFEHYNIPLGLINKYVRLKEYNLHNIIDDSGSTKQNTDVKSKDAHPKLWLNRTPKKDNELLTRFEEMEHRCHIIADFISFLPGMMINYAFLNDKAYDRPQNFKVTNQAMTPQNFADDLHQRIRNAFGSITPTFATPIREALEASLEEARQNEVKTIHNVYFDGCPTKVVPDLNRQGRNKIVDDIKATIDVIKTRENKEANPIALNSCTNVDAEVAWVKEVEEDKPQAEEGKNKNKKKPKNRQRVPPGFCSESDDFHDEAREVAIDQGPAFPYSYGFWIANQLLAAINPDDLDRMDENLPFTRHTLSELLGYQLSDEQYAYYFNFNPHAKLYIDLYDKFLTSKDFSPNLIDESERSKRERLAGYNNGDIPMDDKDKDLYAFMPLSRYTYSQLYLSDSVKNSLFQSHYIPKEKYQAYFDSHPAIQKLDGKYKDALFKQLSAKEKAHAPQILEDSLAEFRAQVKPNRYQNANTSKAAAAFGHS